jgi:hypothetical protein
MLYPIQDEVDEKIQGQYKLADHSAGNDVDRHILKRFAGAEHTDSCTGSLLSPDGHDKVP